MEVVSWWSVKFMFMSQEAFSLITFLRVDSWSSWESNRQNFWRWGWNILWTSSPAGGRKPANYSSFSCLSTPYYSLNPAYRCPTLSKSIRRGCGEHLHVKWHQGSILCDKDTSNSLRSVRNIFVARKENYENTPALLMYISQIVWSEIFIL